MESIEYGAFRDCSSLESIVIPDKVTGIPRCAFSGCTSLESIVFGKSVSWLGEQAFSGCTSLKSVTIPDSVNEVDGYVFSGCTSLTSVTLPSSITTMGIGMFSGCTSLRSVVLPDSLTEIGRYLFSGCTSLTSVTIPDSATSVGMDAFSGCTSLESVDLGDSVSYIGRSAFQGCTSLSSVAFGDALTDIDRKVFYGCEALTSIIFPDSLEYIGQSAFDGCVNLTYIGFPGSLEYVNGAFHGFNFYDTDGVTRLPTDSSTLAGFAFKGETIEKMVKQDPGTRTYAVTYDVDGGSSSAPAGGRYAAGEEFTLKGYSGTKNGYVFSGWRIGTTSYSVGETVEMSAKDMTFVADWVVGKRVTSVSLSDSLVILDAGETYRLVATVTPTDAAVKDVVWTSADKSVATVDANGRVTAVGSGKTTIRVSTVDGGLSASCVVAVGYPDLTVYVGADDGTLSAVVYSNDGVSVPAGKMRFVLGYHYRDGSGKQAEGSYSVESDVGGGKSMARVFADADKIQGNSHYSQVDSVRAVFVYGDMEYGSSSISISFSGSDPVSEDLAVSIRSAGDGNVYVTIASLDGGRVPAGKITMELNYSVYSKALEDWVDRSDSTKNAPVSVESDGTFVLKLVDLSDSKHPTDYTSAVAMFTVDDGDGEKTYLSDITGYSGRREA